MAKRFFIVAAMLVSLVIGAAIANADPVWKTVTITQAGMNGTTAFVKATDNATSPSFTNRYFVIPTATQNVILATALSAISSGKNATLAVTTIDPHLTGSVTALFLNQ